MKRKTNAVSEDMDEEYPSTVVDPNSRPDIRRRASSSSRQPPGARLNDKSVHDMEDVPMEQHFADGAVDHEFTAEEKTQAALDDLVKRANKHDKESGAHAIPWEIRQERVSKAWREAIPLLIKGHFMYHGLATEYQRMVIEYEKQLIEKLAADAWKYLPSSQIRKDDDSISFLPCPPEPTGYQIIHILTFEAVIQVTIPVWSDGTNSVHLDPQAIGCWATNPTVLLAKSSYWVKKSLLEFYSVAGPKYGFSATGEMIKTICRHRLMTLSPTAYLESLTELQELSGNGPKTQLKAEKFESYFCSYLDSVKASTSMEGMKTIPLNRGPLGSCGICGGRSEDEYILALLADACKKCSLFASAGGKGEDAIHKVFIGEGEASTDALIRNIEEGNGGTLPSLGDYLDENCHSHSTTDGKETQCDAHISCNRETTSRATKMSVVGVALAVCCHGIPCKGSLVDMRTEEQYIYFIIMITTMLYGMHLVGGKIDEVFLDYACRFKKTWARYAGPEGKGCSVPGANNFKFLVNWMHGSSHNLYCQLLNLGRYIKGSGHRDGEGIERFNKWLKVRILLFPLSFLV